MNQVADKTQALDAITFGPVPSRRLGRSLGVNNIPAKVCSYSCIYCQVGRTTLMTARRRAFYEPEAIVSGVRNRVALLKRLGEPIDFLTFVPDGEPTLDVGLGATLDLLRPLGIKLAVISNSSLLWMPSVRQDLKKADWVSVKVDTTDEKRWREVNRPHGGLRLQAILGGLLHFKEEFQGDLVTETMLVQGVNTTGRQLRHTAAFLAQLQPDRCYLSVPIRPPAERRVEMPDEQVVTAAYQIFHEELAGVELLTGYEGNAFASTGDLVTDLLAVTAVHPIREDAVQILLDKACADWLVIDRLVEQGRLTETEYLGKKFYIRAFPGRHGIGRHAHNSFLTG
jgi:wyosine [tRNA(Phe)-imidazoG37] synthetase (radical SAM superfamily)